MSLAEQLSVRAQGATNCRAANFGVPSPPQGVMKMTQADAGEIVKRLRKGRSANEWVSEELALNAASLIERQAARIETLEKMDREAATYVESVICMRTHFTGEPPYVGWKGLGLALSETLDQYEQSKAEIERQAAEIAYWKEQATELGRTRQRNEAEIERLREALEDMATDERKKYSPGWFIAVARATLSTTGSEE